MVEYTHDDVRHILWLVVAVPRSSSITLSSSGGLPRLDLLHKPFRTVSKALAMVSSKAFQSILFVYEVGPQLWKLELTMCRGWYAELENWWKHEKVIYKVTCEKTEAIQTFVK